MRAINFLTHFTLLTTTPLLLAQPQDHQSVQHQEHKSYKDLSYDEIMELLDAVESGEFEKTATLQELQDVMDFLELLAEKGGLPHEELVWQKDMRGSSGGDLFYCVDKDQYIFAPAVYAGSDVHTLMCKSWFSKRCKQVKNYVKKHKKAFIIGAAVVVAVAIVVGVVAATSMAATAGAAAASSSDSSPAPSGAPACANPSNPPSDASAIAAIEDHLSNMKDKMISHTFFQDAAPNEHRLSFQEEGRIMGDLLAHDSLNYFQNQLPCSPGFDSNFSQGKLYDASLGHQKADQKFSTDYGYLFSDHKQDLDFVSHQARGEKALDLGYYNQAVEDFGRAIDTNPTNPDLYLKRGIGNLELGQYDACLEDYKQFISHAPPPNPLSVPEFCLGFAKGVPQGVYESGEGMFLFLSDVVVHPIHTANQVVDSISTLVDLVKRDEWEMVAQALSPEMHQLVTEWDALSSFERGELAGFTVGKVGTDFLAPGGIAAIAGKSVKAAEEIAKVCKGLKTAQEALLLETAASVGNGAKLAEIVESGKQISFVAEELGYNGRQIGQLKKAGQLETSIANHYELSSSFVKESIEKHRYAKEILKPYIKIPMPEEKVRMYIHSSGIPSFPRPRGIPENYLVKITERGAGMEYVHPTNTHLSVRVMPGKPHSRYPHQQKPYVVQMKDGKAFDKHGNLIPHESPEAHIPVDEFIYRK